MASLSEDALERFIRGKGRALHGKRTRLRRELVRGVEGAGGKLRNDAPSPGSAMGYRKCRRWGCNFKISADEVLRLEAEKDVDRLLESD